MMPNNFYSLVKEEPETISETEMDTAVVPPTSCGMQGHMVGTGGVAPPHVVGGTPMGAPGLPLTPVTPTSMQPPHLKYLDIDPHFEPVARSRSNTWPLPRPEGYIDGEEPSSIVPTGDMPTPTGDPGARPPGLLGQPGEPTGPGGPKKNTSRRNPWGNMSYADLIAQAILSSPDHRATLSQVYDWMVQNVPYFKDKGDSNSSAGWKNSIRHNLSLHNRFMRVQNEGTGKSSWWVLNPDAKPGKSTRRRANTNPMEGGRFEKKRGRVKKKMEWFGQALRNGLDTTPSPSSSISENLDLYPDSPLTHPAFGQLSPQDFRPRASSNASSCGRLSPIPAIESDMHDAQVPPMSPGIGGWGPADYWGHHGPHLGHHHLDRYTDQLVDGIGEGLKLGSAGDWTNHRHGHPNPSDCMKLTQLSPHGPHHPPPPPGLMNGFHPHHHHHHHPQGPYGSFEDFHRFGPHNTHTPNYSLPPAHQDKMHTPTRPPHPHSNYTLTNLQVRPQAMSPAHSAHSLSPTQPLGEGHYPGPGGEAHQPTSSFPSPPSSQASPHSGVPTSEASNMLRQALQHRDQQQQQQQQQRERDNQHREQQRDAQQENQQQQQHRDQQQQRNQTAGAREGSSSNSSSSTSGSRSTGGNSSGSSSSSGGSSNSSSSTGPGGQPMQDFVDLDTIQGGLECNVEEVIKHELQMGGSLDFSFPQAHHHHHGSHHAHTHHHAHHQHMGADHSRPQMPGPPAMPPYNCNSIAAGNHWVR